MYFSAICLFIKPYAIKRGLVKRSNQTELSPQINTQATGCNAYDIFPVQSVGRNDQEGIKRAAVPLPKGPLKCSIIYYSFWFQTTWYLMTCRWSNHQVEYPLIWHDIFFTLIQYPDISGFTPYHANESLKTIWESISENLYIRPLSHN